MLRHLLQLKKPSQADSCLAVKSKLPRQLTGVKSQGVKACSVQRMKGPGPWGLPSTDTRLTTQGVRKVTNAALLRNVTQVLQTSSPASSQPAQGAAHNPTSSHADPGQASAGDWSSRLWGFAAAAGTFVGGGHVAPGCPLQVTGPPGEGSAEWGCLLHALSACPVCYVWLQPEAWTAGVQGCVIGCVARGWCARAGWSTAPRGCCWRARCSRCSPGCWAVVPAPLSRCAAAAVQEHTQHSQSREPAAACTEKALRPSPGSDAVAGLTTGVSCRNLH